MTVPHPPARQPDLDNTLQLDPADAELRQRLQLALGADYELRELLGQGGMGAVYVAFDARLEREVAVKTLRHDVFPSRVTLERFQREAKALARLRHASILPVYGVGERQGIAYMITPRIEGSSLRDVLDREERLPADVTARIGAEIARALDAAHRLGIIHRDVKPDNILLEGDERHALLADFGIAKSPAEEAQLTATGMMVGSPRYMSPEQVAAERDIDARTDIYALGAAMYEMLSGRPAFEASSLQRLVVLKMTTDPAPLQSVEPSTPPELVAIVTRCLARDPADRWQSAAELADALSGLAASATGSHETEPERSWLEKRGLLAMGLGFVYDYLDVASTMFAQGDGGGEPTRFILKVVMRPMSGLLVLMFIVFALEIAVTFARSLRSGSWSAAARAVLGQPRWWLAWYPRSLRPARSAWERMPGSVKALRTFLFVDLLMLPVALPLIFVVPYMEYHAASANIALPWTLRATITASEMAQSGGIGYIIFALLPLGIVTLALWRRTSIAAVMRSVLFGQALPPRR